MGAYAEGHRGLVHIGGVRRAGPGKGSQRRPRLCGGRGTAVEGDLDRGGPPGQRHRRGVPGTGYRRDGARTVIVTVSDTLEVPRLSVTTRVKVWEPTPRVTVGCATLAGSGVPVQLKVVSVAPGSVGVEALPSRVTKVMLAPPDSVTVRRPVVRAIGGDGARTVIVIVSQSTGPSPGH